MAKKHRNLIARIVADANMREAYRRTAAGKRLTPGYLEFKEFSVLNLEQLATDMRRGDYRQGTPHEFPDFRSETAHHHRAAVPRSRGAARRMRHHWPDLRQGITAAHLRLPAGKGHARRGDPAAERFAAIEPRQPAVVFSQDRFFALLRLDRSRRAVAADRAQDQRRRNARGARADGAAPGIGLPIGSLTSQILANVYGGVVDRHLQQDLGESWWYRYMDDLVVLGPNSAHLRQVKESIEQLSHDRLGLRFSKWQIAPVSRGINFLGYRIWATHKLLRRDSVTRARRKLLAYRAAGDDVRLGKFLGAWLGHAQWADSGNLLANLGLGEADAS